MMHGYKTKMACVLMLAAAVLYWFHPREGMCLFMAAMALAFYGVHYRVKRIKKATLRSGQ